MRISCFIILLFITSFSYAQDSTLVYRAKINLAGSNGKTPFWLHVNQNGTIPMDGTFGSGQFALYKIYNSNNPRFIQFSSGVEVIANYGKSSNFFLSDAYLATRFGVVELMVGQKKSMTGLTDTTLTTGSLAVSGNSRPFPRIQLSIPDYYTLPFLNKILALKASYSDGLLHGSDISYGSTPYVDQVRFHQKSLYFRFGNKNGRLLLFTGLNHQAIWGGENEIWPADNLKPADAYWHTVMGKTFNYKKVGNHFGTLDIAGEWKGEKWSWFLYRQYIYESGSSFKITNYVDGLNGLLISRSKKSQKHPSSFSVQSFLFEVISTQNQTNQSPAFGLAIFNKADYFNHYIYKNGWSYLGRSIGTPLIPGSNILSRDAVTTSNQFSNNNRSWVFHAGISATWLNAQFRFKGTYSRNMGTYLYPFEMVKKQMSLLLNVEKKVPFWKNTDVTASLASDMGKLYPNSTSLMIGLKKDGFLN